MCSELLLVKFLGILEVEKLLFIGVVILCYFLFVIYWWCGFGEVREYYFFFL